MQVLDRTKVSSLMAFAYALLVLVGILVHFAISGDIFTLRSSLGLTSTWLATVIGLVVGLGLWRHYRWAWWLGVVAAHGHVFFMLFWLGRRVPLLSHFPITVYLALALQLAFLWAAARRATYLECSR